MCTALNTFLKCIFSCYIFIFTEKTIPHPPSSYKIKKPEKSDINKKQDEDRELSQEKSKFF